MKESTLMKYYNKIEWVECKDYNIKPIEKFPASQGYLILELIKRYKLPFHHIGYSLDIVGIKTKRQCLLWRDTGIGATFLGIINLEDNTISFPEDETPKADITFNTFKELSAEIGKRKYNKIVGLKANITEEEYWNFLEALPPLKMGSGWFVFMEALTDETYYKFINKDNKFQCEVIRIEHEEVEKLEMKI